MAACPIYHWARATTEMQIIARYVLAYWNCSFIIYTRVVSIKWSCGLLDGRTTELSSYLLPYHTTSTSFDNSSLLILKINIQNEIGFKIKCFIHSKCGFGFNWSLKYSIKSYTTNRISFQVNFILTPSITWYQIKNW